MGFLDSLNSISNAVSSAKELTNVASNVSGFLKKGKNDDKEENESNGIVHEEIYPERIEKLIRLVLSEGELDEDSIQMLEKASIKEGLDPDEVIFVTKKRMKRGGKAASARVPQLTPAQSLAAQLAELDAKFNAAIEGIRMGDNSGASALFDAVTGGAGSLAVSIGKSIFGKSDDEKIYELEELRDEQRSRIIASTTLPDNQTYLIELLEFVNNQVKMKSWTHANEKNAWKGLHQAVFNRATVMVSNDAQLRQYIETLKPVKKKFGLF